MPLLSTSGAAAARAYGFGGTPRSMTYRGSSFFANSSGVTSKTIVFSGVNAQAGDLGIVCYFTPANSSDTTAMAGWTKLTYQFASPYLYVVQIYYKVLSAGDVSTGATITGLSSNADQSSLIWGAYGGVTTASLIGSSSASAGGTSLTVIAGTTHGIGYVSLSAVQWSTADTQSVTAGGFTLRTQGATADTFSNQALADLTIGSSYVDRITWAQTVSDLNRGAAILRLT